jgi:predicted PurR-regulated permease PerM
LPIAAGVFLALATLGAIIVFARAFAVLVLSITVADAVSPLAERLHRRMRWTIAVSLVYAGILGVGALLGWLLVPSIALQVRDIVERAPSLIQAAEERFRYLMHTLPGSANPNLTNLVAEFSQKLLSVPITLATTAITIAIMFFLSLYWLLAAPGIGKFVRSLFPDSWHPELNRLRARMSQAMGGYIRGVSLNAVATGGLAGLALYFAGVNYAFALGTLTALGEFFPYLGPIVTAVPGIIVAFLQSPSLAFWTAIIYLGVQQIEGHLLTPNIMRSQTDLPQPLVIIAIFAGGVVGGLLGAVVALPLAGAAKVLVEEVVGPLIRRTTERYFGGESELVVNPSAPER